MATRDPVGASSAGHPSRPSVTGGTKGTFFCPECPHRSRFDGNWTIVETDCRLQYLCPNCDAEVTTRRTSFADDAARVETDPD